MIAGWFARLVDLPLRRPAAVLAAVLVVTVAALFAWPLVRFEPDVSRLLPPEHPHVQVAQLLDDRARPSRVLWILLAGRDLERVVPDVQRALGAAPQVAEVVATRTALFSQAASRAEAAPLWGLDDAERARLAAALSPDGLAEAAANVVADLADDPMTARELAVQDPLGVRWLLAADARWQALGFAAGTDLLLLADRGHALLQLRGRADAFDADFATALCDEVERVLAAAPIAGHELFGGYTVARADQARIRADFERASTWSIVAIALYLCWAMRGLRLPLLVQLPATLSIVWAIPFGSLCFGALPTVAVAAVAVLCGLGVDFAIHYAARYREARLTRGHADAVRHTQRTTVVELSIDMATTAVTFLAIGAGTAGSLRAFGLLLAFGLVGSLLFTVFALPVLLRYAGDRRDPERSFVASAADRWIARGASRGAAWAAVAVAIAGAVLVLTRGIPVSAEAESLRPADDPVAAARARIEQQVGFATVPVVALWPLDEDPSRLQQALVAARADGLLRFWSGLEAVETSAGGDAVARCRADLGDFVPRAEAALVAQGLDPAPFRPSLDGLAARLAADPAAPEVTTVPLDGVMQRAVTLWPTGRLDRDGFQALAQRLSAAAGPDVQLHGGPTVAVALEQMLVGDLGRACVLAALLAVLMVTVWLRSLPRGLLALVPSAIGLVATLVGLQVFDIPLSMVSFVAVPFVLGIGVDEGVHLVGHFRHGAKTTGATGVGIVRTSLGTVLGFSALLLAESPGLQLLGATVAFGSSVCMLSCLFVLAPLLAKREGG